MAKKIEDISISEALEIIGEILSSEEDKRKKAAIAKVLRELEIATKQNLYYETELKKILEEDNNE